MTNSTQIDCPNCGHPVIVRTTSDAGTSDKGFKPWPPKESREKIAAEIQKMSQAVTAGFKQIFHPDLWK